MTTERPASARGDRGDGYDDSSDDGGYEDGPVEPFGRRLARPGSWPWHWWLVLVGVVVVVAGPIIGASVAGDGGHSGAPSGAGAAAPAVPGVPQVSQQPAVRVAVGPLNVPAGVAVAPNGAVVVADAGNNRIREILPNGTMRTLAGTGAAGYGGDGGPATSARLNSPGGVAVAPDGTVYVADTGNDAVRSITTAGRISTVAGTGTAGFSGDGGPAAAARLNTPGAVAFGGGALYIADTNNDAIRRVAGGRITTVAGGDSTMAGGVKLFAPHGVAVAANGTAYIADTGNDAIRVLGPSGRVTTLTDAKTANDLSGQVDQPQSVAPGPGGVLFASSGDATIYRVDSAGHVVAIGGTGAGGFSGDGGPASAAQISEQVALAAAQNGTIYVADTTNSRIRRIDPSGRIVTIAR